MHCRFRLRLSVYFLLSMLLPISIRLAQLQVLRYKDLSSRVHRSTSRQTVEIIPRGRILDRNGRVLAESLPAWSAFLDLKVFAEDPKHSAAKLRRLAAALGMKLGELTHLTQSRRRTVWLKRKMSYRAAEKLRALRLRSVAIVDDERRYYPNGELARPLLGMLNADGGGAAGLEYAFDQRISGRAVSWKLTRDGSGRVILHGGDRREEKPPDLQLSIDRNIQYIAESALARTVAKHRAKQGMVLIQVPHTGELLAMAVHPSDPHRNSLIQDVYEPGSTFKLVLAAAALESGKLSPEEKIDCEQGRWEISSSNVINDHEKYGALNLKEIIQYSSNIGSAKIGLRLGARTLHRYCRLFGFGYKTGIPLRGESAGLMKSAARISEVNLTRMAFGQGLSVTPLQLIGAFSAVANGGRLMEPRLVRRLGNDPPRGPLAVRRVIGPQTALRLRRILEAVVTEGTGRSARIPGYRIAGKTGTAQKAEKGGYSTTDFVSSFAGYFPARRPQFTVLVVIDSPQVGYYGSIVAAPLFSEITRRLLALRAIPPVLPLPLHPSKRPRPQQAAAPVRAPRRRAPFPAPPTLPGTPLPPHRPLPRPSMLKGRLSTPVSYQG